MRKWIWVLLSSFGLVALVRADSVPTFSRILLQDAPPGAQPNVVTERGHGFLMTWQSARQDVTSLNWMTLNVEGRPTGQGVISEGSNWFVNWADIPALVVLDNGDWVAFWLERNDPDMPEGYDIRVVRSIDRGKTWSSPMSPHRDGTKTQHGFVSMIADGEDRVLMSWLDGRRAADAAAGATSHAAHDHESAPMSLRSAVIDRAGNITREYEIDNRTCSCCQTDMARGNEQKLIVYRDRTEAEIRDISVAINSLGRWEAPSVVHDDQWKIEGCPVNGPAIAANGERGLIFWPTVTDDKMTLRYVVADSPRALSDKPQMRTLPVTQMPSGRVDAIAWKDGFLLTWISRARDRPAVDYAYVHPDGRVEAGLSIAEPALRGRATGFPRAASDGKTAIVVWPELDVNGNAVIGVAMTR